MMIKIEQITPLLKPGYVARDKSGDIYWFDTEPFIAKNGNFWTTGGVGACESFKDFGCLKEIEIWAEDWKNSLIKIGEE